MSTKSWTSTITAIYHNPKIRLAALVIWYVAILIGVLVLSSSSNFSTPTFVYQGF